jgi:hypothetical protein
MRIILIANKFQYIYAYCVDNKIKKLNEKTLNYFKRTKVLVDLFYDSYYKKELRNIEKVDKEKGQLIEEIKKIISMQKGHDNVVVYHLAEAVRLIYDNSSQMLGVIL